MKYLGMRMITMTNKEFKQIFEKELASLIKTAKAVLQHDGHHSHMVFAFMKGGGVEVIQNLYDGVIGKNMSFAHLRKRMRKKSDGYISINEAWVCEAPKDADPSKIIPSQHPDRKEALLIMGVTPNKAVSITIPFTRKGKKFVFEKEQRIVVPTNQRHHNKLDAWYFTEELGLVGG
jgi:hypothetical protein